MWKITLRARSTGSLTCPPRSRMPLNPRRRNQDARGGQYPPREASTGVGNRRVAQPRRLAQAVCARRRRDTNGAASRSASAGSREVERCASGPTVQPPPPEEAPFSPGGWCRGPWCRRLRRRWGGCSRRRGGGQLCRELHPQPRSSASPMRYCRSRRKSAHCRSGICITRIPWLPAPCDPEYGSPQQAPDVDAPRAGGPWAIGRRPRPGSVRP